MQISELLNTISLQKLKIKSLIDNPPKKFVISDLDDYYKIFDSLKLSNELKIKKESEIESLQLKIKKNENELGLILLEVEGLKAKNKNLEVEKSEIIKSYANELNDNNYLFNEMHKGYKFGKTNFNSDLSGGDNFKSLNIEYRKVLREFERENFLLKKLLKFDYEAFKSKNLKINENEKAIFEKLKDLIEKSDESKCFKDLKYFSESILRELVESKNLLREFSNSEDVNIVLENIKRKLTNQEKINFELNQSIYKEKRLNVDVCNNMKGAIRNLKSEIAVKNMENEKIKSELKQYENRLPIMVNEKKLNEKLLMDQIVETDKLNKKLNVAKKELKEFRKMEPVEDKNETEMYRSLLKCYLCDYNFKDTVLTKCMHVFCGDCIEQKIKSRIRNCPTCNEKFNECDVKRIYL